MSVTGQEGRFNNAKKNSEMLRVGLLTIKGESKNKWLWFPALSMRLPSEQMIAPQETRVACSQV